MSILAVLCIHASITALPRPPAGRGGHATRPASRHDPAPPMILERLGDHRRPVATDSEARRRFDQGLALMNGYNFDGAIASFLEATRHDPEFAMAWWGIGYAAGPNQNNELIVPPKDQWSFAAAQRAYELRGRETGANLALIEALVSRYEYPKPEDLTAQNEAYLAAMDDVAAEHPFDPDVQAWHAEAMICLQPWEYWTLEGEPVERTPEFRAILEGVMRQHPDHPVANHLYIHTMESSPWPELADPRRTGSSISSRRRPPRPHALAHLDADRTLRRCRGMQSAAAALTTSGSRAIPTPASTGSTCRTTATSSAGPPRCRAAAERRSRPLGRSGPRSRRPSWR